MKPGMRSQAGQRGEAYAGAPTGSSEREQLRQETMLVACAAAILSFIALAYCTRHGMLLLFGDAVAHLGIARRLGDSLNPGFRQLGSVWLPFPHVLLYPLAQNMQLWQSGLAGAPPSMLAYVLGTAGMYRLARTQLGMGASVLAALFYGLNPGLLYLQTTAMTEPIFLAQMVWAAVFVTEHGQAARMAAGPERDRRVRWALLGSSLVLLTAIYTRYDGWVYAAAAWCLLAWHTFGRGIRGNGPRGLFKARSGGAFVLCTAILMAAPLAWLAYNAKQFGDPLEFMRGPYSAKAIDARTSAAGAGHYPGWHNLPIAALYFAKAAELNATNRWCADGLLLASLAGAVLAVRRRGPVGDRALGGARSPALGGALLLFWLPLPFYMYSVAYGSVPIFLPRWYPHGWYNTRYGLEMLPAFALGLACLAETGADWLRMRKPEAVAALFGTVAVAFAGNDYALMRARPLVLGEAYVNSSTRIPFETALGKALRELPPAGLLLMNGSDHVGALQQAGVPLARTINDGDWLVWQHALKDPAHAASYVIALDGDAVAKAVAAHGAGLTLLQVICSTGQPCARVYQSTVPRRYE